MARSSRATNHVGRKGTTGQLVKNISWGSVSKSWRAWLEVSETNENIAAKFQSCLNNLKPHVLIIKEYPGCQHCYARPWEQWPEPWMRLAGCSHGFLVRSPYDIWNRHIQLFEPHGMNMSLPNWDESVPFYFATLSSPYKPFPNRSATEIMAITGISSPAYVVYSFREFRKEQTGWIKHDCTIQDPYDTSKASRKAMAFTNAIGSRGKFYALSSQGALAVIEKADSEFKITCVGKNRAVPSLPCKHFTEYLMDSDGEILLVLLLSRKSINAIDDVQVFQLSFSGRRCKASEKIGHCFWGPTAVCQ